MYGYALFPLPERNLKLGARDPWLGEHLINHFVPIRVLAELIANYAYPDYPCIIVHPPRKVPSYFQFYSCSRSFLLCTVSEEEHCGEWALPKDDKSLPERRPDENAWQVCAKEGLYSFKKPHYGCPAYLHVCQPGQVQDHQHRVIPVVEGLSSKWIIHDVFLIGESIVLSVKDVTGKEQAITSGLLLPSTDRADEGYKQ